MLLRWLLPAPLAVLLWTTGSIAAPITVSFPGVFTKVDDPDQRLDPVISVGTFFVFSYTIEPESVEARACSSGDGWKSCRYIVRDVDFPGALLSVGDRVLVPGILPVVVEITGHYLWDDWTLDFETLKALTLGLRFVDPLGERVSDPQVFFVNRSTEGWSIARLFISGGDPPQLLATGMLIPEPTSAALLLPALLALIAWRIARRRAALAVLGLVGVWVTGWKVRR